jgi:hypothetical protein
MAPVAAAQGDTQPVAQTDSTRPERLQLPELLVKGDALASPNISRK